LGLSDREEVFLFSCPTYLATDYYDFKYSVKGVRLDRLLDLVEETLDVLGLEIDGTDPPVKFHIER